MARLSIEELLEMSELPASLTAKRQPSSAKKASVQRVPLPAPVGVPKACGPTAPRQATAGHQPASGLPTMASLGSPRSAATPGSASQQLDLASRPSALRVPASVRQPATVEPDRSLSSSTPSDVHDSSGVSQPDLTTPRRDKVASYEPVMGHVPAGRMESSEVTPPLAAMAQIFDPTPVKMQQQGSGHKARKKLHPETSKSHASTPVRKAPKARPAALAMEQHTARDREERIADLEREKRQAVAQENYDKAQQCKEELDRLRSLEQGQQQEAKSSADPSTPQAAAWELVPWTEPQSPEKDQLLVLSKEKSDKGSPRPKRMDVAALRGLDLKEVPVAEIAAQTSETQANGRPRRLRFPPIEFWRNERIEYERLPGSFCPSVRAVVRNMATFGKNLLALGDRPEQLAIEDTHPKELAIEDRRPEASAFPVAKRRRRSSSQGEEVSPQLLMRGSARQEPADLAIELGTLSSLPSVTKRRRHSSKRVARSPSPAPVAKRGRRSGACAEYGRVSSRGHSTRGRPARK